MSGGKIPGRIIAVCVSEKNGERKTPVASVELLPDHGVVGDVHAGDFAENNTNEGVDLVALPVGYRL